MPKLEDPIIEYLTAAGFDIRVAYWGRHGEQERIGIKLVSRVQDLFRIRRWMLAGPASAIFVHTSHNWLTLLRDIPLLAGVRSSGRPVIVQLHGSAIERVAKSLLFRSATRLLASSADAILVMSNEEASELKRWVPASKIHTVSYLYVPPKVRRRPTALSPNEPLRLLFAGRLVAEKGILDLLEAIELDPGMNVSLCIAGEGGLLVGIRHRIARSANLQHKVLVAGYLTGGALEDAYNKAEVFVLPTYHAEGFPHAVIDALGHGLGLICTRTRGIGDHLEEPRNALFVPARNPEALARAIYQLAVDRKLVAAMQGAAREVTARFLPGEAGAKYADILRQLSPA